MAVHDPPNGRGIHAQGVGNCPNGPAASVHPLGLGDPGLGVGILDEPVTVDSVTGRNSPDPLAVFLLVGQGFPRPFGDDLPLR